VDAVYTVMRTFGFLKNAEDFLPSRVNCSFSRKTVSRGLYINYQLDAQIIIYS